MDVQYEVDQIKELIKDRCPDVISQYTRLDTSRDGKYSWDELEPIVQDFYGSFCRLDLIICT